MGCQNSINSINAKFRESIARLDYSSIQRLISENDIHKLDPSLIHDSVKTGQIDLVSFLIDNSIFI